MNSGLSSSRRETWTAAGVGLALVSAMTYPTVTSPATFGRMDSGDGRYSIWNIGWIGHALLTDPRHLLDANIFYPHTGTLAYSELNLVAGLFGLPAYAVTGNAIAALNCAVAFGLLLSFLLTWALVRRLTMSSGAGLCAATAFTFCPYVQAHTPHIQLLMVFALPLVALVHDRFRAAPTLGRGGALGAGLAVAGLACAYYGIYAGLMLAVLALALLNRERRRDYWIGIGVAAIVAAALTLPVFIPYLHARAAAGAAAGMSRDEIQSYSATFLSYVTSPSYVHEELRDRWRLFKPAAESLFPGFLASGLAFLGLVAAMVERVSRVPGVSESARAPQDRRVAVTYLAIGVLACWASFGPAAFLYSWLLDIVPAIGMLRAPVRLGVVVMFVVAVLSGFGVRYLASKWPRIWLAVVPLMALETATLPWPLVQVGAVPEAYQLLARAPRAAVVEFPFMYKRTDLHNHSRYMFYSVYHWQPLVNGYSDVIPQDFVDLTGPRGDGSSPINDFPDRASFELLRQRQVKYVIWHMDARSYDAASREKILKRIAPYEGNLRRLTTDQDTWLYEIVAWP